MKQCIVFSLLLILTCCAPQVAEAGFWKKTSPASVSMPGTSVVDTGRTRTTGNYHSHNRQHKEGSGWEGIVSFVCAMTFTLAPLGVIFGILGLNKKNHGFALAGLIIGALTILLIAAEMILIVHMGYL